MPIDLTTITGTIYDVLGQPKPGVDVFIVSAVKSGLSIYDEQTRAATSDSNGAVSFTVPRASTVWLQGTFFIGATDFTVSTGISLVIPDAPTATLESLGAAYAVPDQGLTIKSNGSALGNLCVAIDFSSDFDVTESPTGEANVELATPLADLQTALDLKAPLASPALAGTPTAPTAAQGTNTTQVSTTAFVRAELAALVGTVPSTLDTLDELAQALGDDPNFAATVTTALGTKANTSSLAPVALSGSAADLSTGTLPDGRFPSTLPAASGANLTGLTKAQVGLSNVDNTTDANKPVSTAQAAADSAVASAAASDATTKANNAQSAAIAAAASDATTKANTAQANAIAADPVKASGAEVTTGTDDAKFVTAKALADAGIEAGGGATPNITIPMLLSSTEVNLNEGTAAKQPLYTCPANRKCIIVRYVMHQFSGNATSAVFTLGWDAGASNVSAAPYDFAGGGAGASAVKFVNLPAYSDDVGGNYIYPSSPLGTAGDVLGLKVTVPQGSTLTAVLDVFGYWTDTNGVPIANVVGTAP